MALVFPSSPTPGQTYVGPNNITYTWDNTLQVWTGSSPGAGGLTAASPAQAAAGTLNTVASTPQTAVPKDASGMTGAAILPSGTTAQRPASPASGMVRVNTDTNPQLEQYANSAWQPIGVITSNLTLNVATTGNDTTGLGTVAAPWATPQRAMEYLSAYAIKQGVTVTVSVADGTYTFTTPLVLNHPNGSQIFINGGTTSGVRPTTSLTGGNAVGNTAPTLAANDALLNAYYNTKWQFNGCHGLVCDSGGNVTVNTVLIRGNAAASFTGVLAGNYNSTTGYASSGGINLGATVAVNNFGYCGVLVNQGGSILASDVTVTNSGNTNFGVVDGGSVLANNAISANSGGNGIGVVYGGSIIVSGATARYNGGCGITTTYGGSINADSATASNNGGSGVLSADGGSIRFASGTASNNAGYGLTANSSGGFIDGSNATALSNALGTNVFVYNMGNIYFTGGNAGGLLSPAANTVGNGNAIITV